MRINPYPWAVSRRQPARGRAGSAKTCEALTQYIVRSPVSLQNLLVDEGGTDTVLYRAPYSDYFKTDVSPLEKAAGMDVYEIRRRSETTFRSPTTSRFTTRSWRTEPSRAERHHCAPRHSEGLHRAASVHPDLQEPVAADVPNGLSARHV